MTTHALTSAAFDETIAAHDIVLIDFWADWCGPCKQFAPVFEEASQQHTDIYFAKVDTEAERELAARAQISSIPTLMAFREGICVFAQPGALPQSALEELIGAVRGLDMDDVHRQVAEQQAGGSEADEIDLDEFAARHAAGGYVLDVREPVEYAAGHVAGAVSMPMSTVPARMEEIPKDQEILVICQVGGRSRQVVDYLRGHGITAINIAGGTAGWADRGWHLER